MFDLRAIRENPDHFRKAWNRRASGLGDKVDDILAHDAALRQALTDKQEAESARNANSKLIGKAKASGDEAEFERLRDEVAEAKKNIEVAGEQEEAARKVHARAVEQRVAACQTMIGRRRQRGKPPSKLARAVRSKPGVQSGCSSSSAAYAASALGRLPSCQLHQASCSP